MASLWLTVPRRLSSGVILQGSKVDDNKSSPSLLSFWPSPHGAVSVNELNHHLKLRHIDMRQANSHDVVAQYKASRLGRFYINYFKKYPFVRELVNWLWRNAYPVYVNNIAARFGRRNILRWRRLIKLSEYIETRGTTVIQLARAALIKTPVPKVFPVCDQGYLVSPHDHYTSPHIYVATIGDGMIYGGTNLVLTKEAVICHDLYDFERDYTSEELNGRTLIDPVKGQIRWLLHDDAPEYLPAAAAFVDACAHNYAHWLTEVLPRIAVFCADEHFKKVPIVVNDGLHENIMESLLLIVGPEREVVTLPIGRALKTDALYLTSAAGYVPFGQRDKKLCNHSHGVFNPYALDLIRAQVASYVVERSQQSWPEKLCLRRNSNVRKITNWNEIEEDLIAAGYAVIEPENLSFLEQVVLFMNAKYIVSATGAALANSIFCSPGAHIGILMAKHESMIYRYWPNMLATFQLKVACVLGNINKNNHFGIHGDYFVDRDCVTRLLKSW